MDSGTPEMLAWTLLYVLQRREDSLLAAPDLVYNLREEAHARANPRIFSNPGLRYIFEAKYHTLDQ